MVQSLQKEIEFFATKKEQHKILYPSGSAIYKNAIIETINEQTTLNMKEGILYTEIID